MAEMAAAEEAAVGREGRRVRRGKHKMFCLVDKCAFGYGIAAPEEEDDAAALCRQGLYGGVGESLPAVALVAAGLMGTHGEGGVEQ